MAPSPHQVEWLLSPPSAQKQTFRFRPLFSRHSITALCHPSTRRAGDPVASPDRVFHLRKVSSSDHLLLRLRLLRWQIFLRSCVGRSRRSQGRFGLALLLVCLTTLGSLWRQRAGLVSFVDRHAIAACVVASILTLLTGMLAGWGAARGARRDLTATWLAVLPWSDRQRKRAMLVSCLPPFGLTLVSLSIVALPAGALIRPLAIPLLALAGSAAAGLGFVTGVAILPARRERISRLVQGGARHSKHLALADQARPRWLGSWALEGRGHRLVRLWFVLLASLGALGIAGTLETGAAAPAAMIGIAGGHLMFLIALRARPLRADALRLLPVSFPRAAWGVVRLPLLLSLGWFLLPEAAAFAAAPGDPVPAGGLIGLLLLDGLACLSWLWLADAPLAALLLHGTVLALGLQYWARLGLSELALLLGLAVLLWRGAQRRFIEGINRRASRDS